jgi:hypothetical protein
MRQITYLRERRRSSRSMQLAAFLSIVGALILTAPIALASPPDPSWIAGIYDGADGDDVVTLVYETAGVEAVSLGSVLPLPRSSNVSIVSGPRAIRGFAPHQFSRGPPTPSALGIHDVRSRLRHLARSHACIALRSVSPPPDPVRMQVAARLPTGEGCSLREL